MPSLSAACRYCSCAHHYLQLLSDCWLTASLLLRSVDKVLSKASSPASTCAHAAASGRSTRPVSPISACSSSSASRFWPGSRSMETDWWSCAMFGYPSLLPLRTTCSAESWTWYSTAFSHLAVNVLLSCVYFLRLLFFSMDCLIFSIQLCFSSIIFSPNFLQLHRSSTLSVTSEYVLRCLAPTN